MKYILLKIRQVRRIDFVILFSVIVLALYGVINIFNATNSNSARRQLLFVIVSLIILCIILFIDYSNIKPFISLLYYSNVILLIFTKIFSEKVNGANGWIQIGSFTLQPSEFMKISLILMLAKVIDENEGKINEKDMIDYVLKHERVDIKKLREDAAIMMSCKKSIKANHYLRNHEMAHLIDELRETTDPFTCPHGRPIIIELTTYELEKLFKRVM